MLSPRTSIRTLLAFTLISAPTFAQQSERSGEEVYKQLCAVCHGDNGDGKGLIQLDRPARSFRDGGFSFGNTKEAISRTVGAGIGGTPMPGFASMLSEAELEAVAEYVIAFGPKQPEAPDAAMRLTVGKRPQVVRGHLPPVAPGKKDHPRGLLIGTTDGLSWEFAADDLRLLAVRQGEFVSREDWKGRGGTPLKPLGRIVHLIEGGEPASEFVQFPPEHIGSAVMRSTAYRRQLTATEVREGRAWIESKVMEQGTPIATVRESGEAFSLSTVAGYRRTFEIERHTDARLHFYAGSGPRNGELESIPLDNAGFLCFVPQGEDAGTAYFFQTRTVVDYIANAHGVSVKIPTDEQTAGFAVTVFPLPAGAQEAWAQIKKEVMP